MRPSASRSGKAANASSACVRSCVTEAGCASSATRLPRSALRSAREASKRSKPNFIEHSRRATRRSPRRRESRGCPAGAAARSSSSGPRGPRRRPSSPRATAMVRRRARGVPCWPSHAARSASPRRAICGGLAKRERPHALPIAVELIRRPFRRWREIELEVARAPGPVATNASKQCAPKAARRVAAVRGAESRAAQRSPVKRYSNRRHVRRRELDAGSDGEPGEPAAHRSDAA